MEAEYIKKIYNGYSSVYDALFKRFFYPRIQYAINTMGIRPGERILDVGVGTGLSLGAFPRHCAIVGIDLSRDMLKKAHEKVDELGLTNVHLIEMDAMELDFKDDSFDKVFLSHVVSVATDPYRVMSEVKRVCRKDGKIVVVNHFRSRNPILSGFEKFINPISVRMGWRQDLSMEEFIRGSGLKVDGVIKLKKFDFWHLLFMTNTKERTPCSLFSQGRASQGQALDSVEGKGSADERPSKTPP